MRRHRTALPLAGYTIQQVEFDPTTFQPEDLFWLLYHASLNGWGRKQQAEYLAGRIAAVYTLREMGEKQSPAINDQRQPLWPTPWFSSISHCDQRALTVIADRPVGVDIEHRFTLQMAAGLGSNVISPAEKTTLLRSGLPFPLVLTLTFSAKENGLKATSAINQCALEFADFQTADIAASTLALGFAEQRYLLRWIAPGKQVITLCTLQQ